MITFADSFIGTNTALVGTPIQSCSVACEDWYSTTSNLFRNTTALQASVGSWAAVANITDTLPNVPARLVVEAEMFMLDSGSSNQSNSVALLVSGQRGPDPAAVFARIQGFRSPSSFYTTYVLSVPDAGEYELYSDTTYYTDFVKRRFDVDVVNKTYDCYANDVIINSGTFADDLILDTIEAMGVSVFIQRQGATASASRIKNMYAELYPGSAAPATARFWTDLVNTHEAV